MNVKKFAKKIAAPVGAAIFWLLLWAVVAKAAGSELILPSPSAVVRRAVQLAASKSFFTILFSSFLRVTLGTVGAVIVGCLAAFAAYKAKLVRKLLSPPMTVIKTAPVVSFILAAAFWLGNEPLPAFISFLMVLPIVYENVFAGFASTPRELVELANAFALPPFLRLRRIFIPAATPNFFASLKSASGLAWKAGVAAEVIVSTPLSIGQKMSAARSYLETTDVFAWTAVVVAASLLIEFAISKIYGALAAKTRGYAYPTSDEKEKTYDPNR